MSLSYTELDIHGNEHHLILDYQNLKGLYETICGYSDEKFMSELPSILHVTCIISHLKDVPASCLVGDYGLIHQLAHLIKLGDKNEPLIVLSDIREQFETLMKLA